MKKALFWIGLAIIIFALYGGQSTGLYIGGGDTFILAGIALIVLSRQWELITLFSIMAAVFNYQTLGIDYALETLVLIFLAIASAITGYLK